MIGLSTQVHAGIVSNIDTGKNVEKTMQRRNFPGAEELLQGHLVGLGETEKKAEELVDKAKEFEKIVYDNQKNIERMQDAMTKMQEKSEKKNEYLENKIEELITVNRNSEMRQTACNFESLLATHIYPRALCTPVTFRPIFANLMLWFDENKNAPEGQEANRVWAEFKDQVRWSDEHEKVLHKMLNSESTFSDDDKRYLEEIRKMIELLKRYNP